jgi:arginyl-tRNA synthetase
VRLYRDGQEVKLSKRSGDIITVDEVVDEVGADAVRFLLLTRSNQAVMDFDLNLAVQQNDENPVYYVQYAHARIASILRNVPEDVEAAVPSDPGVFASPHERALIKRLESFAMVVQDAAERRAPHRIAGYAQELAADFHVFYKHCRVIGVQPSKAASRLALCVVAKRVVFRCLDLVGVGAPDSM